MFAQDLHLILAAATAVAVAVVAGEGGVRAVRRSPPGRFASASSSVALVLVGMTAAGGLALLARGTRPKELLHLLYAVAAFVLIPFADSFTARAAARQRGVARVVAGILALGVVARLFATG